MLAPGCQSRSIRTRLFHSGLSITTMTELVVAKEKGLALVGSNCQFPGFSTGPDCCHRTAAGIFEKWWEITTWTLWTERHCTLFWHPVWYSSPSGNWTAILIGIPPLSLCYQQVSFPPSSTSQQEDFLSIPIIFLGENSAHTGCSSAPQMEDYNNSEHFWSWATLHSCLSYDHDI